MADAEHAINARTPLEAARRLRQISQSELARRASVSPSYVASLERGENQPTLSIARRLAATLGFTVDELWPGAAA